MRQYEVYEIQVKGQEPEGSYVDVDITGLFEMNGKKAEVKGFFHEILRKALSMPGKAGSAGELPL